MGLDERPERIELRDDGREVGRGGDKGEER